MWRRLQVVGSYCHELQALEGAWRQGERWPLSIVRINAYTLTMRLGILVCLTDFLFFVW
jgi:hypothetical protein